MHRFVPRARKCTLVVALALCLTPWVRSSTAAPPGLGGLGQLAWPGLTEDDFNRMHAAAAKLYESQSVGTVERWRSPESEDSGEVKLIRSFTANGMPCSELDYVIRFQARLISPDHYVVNWCKVGNGEWKIVEIPAPG
jgi:hypothetical protein